MARHNNQDQLVILQWNARSVVNKRDELMLLISEHNPHIISISETWLSSGQNFIIPGYRVSRKDRNGIGGGVLIAVKNNFTAVATRINTSLEFVCCKVDINNTTISFASIYLPSSPFAYLEMN